MRCKSCNKIMRESEVIWRQDLQQHEDLCLRCRQIVYGYSAEDQETIDLLDKNDKEEEQDVPR